MTEYEKELKDFKQKVTTANELINKLENSNMTLSLAKDRLSEIEELIKTIEKHDQNAINDFHVAFNSSLKVAEKKWLEQISNLSSSIEDINKLFVKFENKLKNTLETSFNNFESQFEIENRAINDNIENLKANDLLNIKTKLNKLNFNNILLSVINLLILIYLAIRSFI